MIVAVCLLALVCVLLLAERHVDRRAWRKERSTLLNAVIAHTPLDFVQLEKAGSKARHPSAQHADLGELGSPELIGL